MGRMNEMTSPFLRCRCVVLLLIISIVAQHGCAAASHEDQAQHWTQLDQTMIVYVTHGIGFFIALFTCICPCVSLKRAQLESLTVCLIIVHICLWGGGHAYVHYIFEEIEYELISHFLHVVLHFVYFLCTVSVLDHKIGVKKYLFRIPSLNPTFDQPMR